MRHVSARTRTARRLSGDEVTVGSGRGPQTKGHASLDVPIEFVGLGSTSVPPSVLAAYASHRLYFALRMFEERIRKVTLRLVDENGPRGGVDSRCLIAVELDRGAPIVAEAITAGPTASMTAAARRLKAVVRRRLDREHGLGRRSAPRGGRLSNGPAGAGRVQ